jgi:hypothetical protein
MYEGPDLFGEVVVTWPDVEAWVEAVAGIPRDSYRFDYYVRAWSVPEKVARAKREGWFEAAITREAPSAYWWSRFRWH